MFVGLFHPRSQRPSGAKRYHHPRVPAPLRYPMVPDIRRRDHNRRDIPGCLGCAQVRTADDDALCVSQFIGKACCCLCLCRTIVDIGVTQGPFSQLGLMFVLVCVLSSVELVLVSSDCARLAADKALARLRARTIVPRAPNVPRRASMPGSSDFRTMS